MAAVAEHGCTAHTLEAVASLMTHLDQRADAAMLLGAAEELRRRSGHVHRPWELSSPITPKACWRATTSKPNAKPAEPSSSVRSSHVRASC